MVAVLEVMKEPFATLQRARYNDSTVTMGVLGNIYCIPRSPGSVAWSTLLTSFVERALVRSPYRAGSPFTDDAKPSEVIRPENWLVPATLVGKNSTLPLRNHATSNEALSYVQSAPSATVTMDCPWRGFQPQPDDRELSAALALYRFAEPFPFRIGVPPDFSDLIAEFPELASHPTEPRWQGSLTELLWLHGKCVPPEADFVGSPLHGVLESVWPNHLVLSDEFL